MIRVINIYIYKCVGIIGYVYIYIYLYLYLCMYI